MNKSLNFFYENFERLDEKSTKTEEELEKLEYGRRENLEIHRIPHTEHESTKEIVKKWLKLLKVKLEDRDISTSHHHFVNNSFPSNHKFTNNRSAKLKLKMNIYQ